MAWNQYLDLSYLNEDGQPDEAHDIRIAGSVTPEGEAKDLLTDYLYQIPRSWLSRFAEEDWQFLFYPNKKFFEAPDTSQGIYYVYHSTDTYYKKVKFTRPEAVLRAFGEYVGFASGCYQKDSRRMEALWKESKQLQPLLKIPDIYSGDAQVYFGSLFAAYVDEETRDEVLKHSPEAGRILDEILASAETEEAGQRMKERLEKRRQEDLERLWWENTEKGYGPGSRKTKKGKCFVRGSKRAGRLVCQLFPFFIKLFQAFLEGFFFLIQFHQPGNVGVDLFLTEKFINLTVSCFQTKDFFLGFFQIVLTFADAGLFLLLRFPVQLVFRFSRYGGSCCILCGSTAV